MYFNREIQKFPVMGPYIQYNFLLLFLLLLILYSTTNISYSFTNEQHLQLIHHQNLSSRSF